MTKFEELTPTGDDWIVREFAKLRAELEELRAARSGEAMTISRGGLTLGEPLAGFQGVLRGVPNFVGPGSGLMGEPSA